MRHTSISSDKIMTILAIDMKIKIRTKIAHLSNSSQSGSRQKPIKSIWYTLNCNLYNIY